MLAPCTIIMHHRAVVRILPSGRFIFNPDLSNLQVTVPLRTRFSSVPAQLSQNLTEQDLTNLGISRQGIDLGFLNEVAKRRKAWLGGKLKVHSSKIATPREFVEAVVGRIGQFLEAAQIRPELEPIISCFEINDYGQLTLGITGNSVGDPNLEALGGVENLFGLDLSRTGITDAGLARLKKLQPDLRALALRHVKTISTCGFRHLAVLGALEELDLVDTNITDDSLRYFKHLQNLARLFLTSSAEIKGPGLTHLKNLKKLKKLDLSETGLTADALKIIGRLTSLKLLSLVLAGQTGFDLTPLLNLLNLEELELGPDQAAPDEVRAFWHELHLRQKAAQK